MSRNLLFIILGLISAGFVYLSYPLVFQTLELSLFNDFPIEAVDHLKNNGLVFFAGIISLFGIFFFTLYLIIPVSYVWYHINLAKSRIEELPAYNNRVARTNKKNFLSAINDLGFIERRARAYIPYLVQGPEEAVDEKLLKNSQTANKTNSRHIKTPIMISPVYATVGAKTFFNEDSLISDNLSLDFFHILTGIILGIGVICFGLSVMSYAFLGAALEIPFMTALQSGLVAFLFCLVAAIFISVSIRFIETILSQNVNNLARMIDELFYQSRWQKDVSSIKEQLLNNAEAEKLEIILQNGLEKPMSEISKAVTGLAEGQEAKLDKILSSTLEHFVESFEKKSVDNYNNMNKALKDTASSADQMKKQLSVSGAAFSKHLDKQASGIVNHLAEMQKILNSREKAAQQGAGKIISSVTSEVERTYGQLGKFVETSLAKLDEKQARIENSENDKESILKDLHNSAKNLGTISNASGKLLEKFTALSKELDGMLINIQKTDTISVLNHEPKRMTDHTIDQANKREKLKMAMMVLTKHNNDSRDNLPKI